MDEAWRSLKEMAGKRRQTADKAIQGSAAPFREPSTAPTARKRSAAPGASMGPGVGEGWSLPEERRLISSRRDWRDPHFFLRK
jgi:hypothetical protein